MRSERRFDILDVFEPGFYRIRGFSKVYLTKLRNKVAKFEVMWDGGRRRGGGAENKHQEPKHPLTNDNDSSLNPPIGSSLSPFFFFFPHSHMVLRPL